MCAPAWNDFTVELYELNWDRWIWSGSLRFAHTVFSLIQCWSGCSDFPFKRVHFESFRAYTQTHAQQQQQNIYIQENRIAVSTFIR